ncbi:hypothetical protein [uncultured Desulfovibrio sp.]|nr:hypothetical protein [uncultured Desulfovibrio sp.]
MTSTQTYLDNDLADPNRYIPWPARLAALKQDVDVLVGPISIR